MSIVAFLTGFFSFFNEIVALIKLLQDTPEQQRAKAIAAVHAAIKKTQDSGGDTSGEEGIING